jgi:hypothetical protein
VHAGTLLKRAEEAAAARVTNVSSGRVINDQCCIWVSFSACARSNWGDLLFPASSFDSGEFLFRHSMSGREIACHAITFSPIMAKFSVSVGVRKETDLQ